MTRQDTASEYWREPALQVGDEILAGETKEDAPVTRGPRMEHVLERVNLFLALEKITQNKGGPGVDGMTLEELPAYLKAHWPRFRQQLLEGTYRPHPVKRKSLPKPGGGERHLGIPMVIA